MLSIDNNILEKFISSNIWYSGSQVDRHTTSLWWMCKITCSQKDDIYKSVKFGRMFFWNDWSIPGDIDWELVLDWRVRWLHPLLLEFFTNTKLKITNKIVELFEEQNNSVHQLITYIVTMRESNNKNCRRCVKKRRLCCSIKHLTSLSWTVLPKEYSQSLKKER